MEASKAPKTAAELARQARIRTGRYPIPSLAEERVDFMKEMVDGKFECLKPSAEAKNETRSNTGRTGEKRRVFSLTITIAEADYVSITTADASTQTEAQ